MWNCILELLAKIRGWFSAEKELTELTKRINDTAARLRKSVGDAEFKGD